MNKDELNQLEQDIADRISEKLDRWHNDAIELCEMANIQPRRGASLLTLTLMAHVVSFMVHNSSVSADEFGEAVTNMFREARKRHQEMKR